MIVASPEPVPSLATLEDALTCHWKYQISKAHRKKKHKLSKQQKSVQMVRKFSQ
jgi:hypothetical protein